MSRRPVGDRLVMSPMEALVAGGAADTLERPLQQLYRGGYRHLVVDLSGVSRFAVAYAVLCIALVWATPVVLCIALPTLDGASMEKSRAMSVEIHTGGRTFPAAYVDARTSPEDLSAQLMADGAGVKSAAWEHSKRERR